CTQHSCQIRFTFSFSSRCTSELFVTIQSSIFRRMTCQNGLYVLRTIPSCTGLFCSWSVRTIPPRDTCSFGNTRTRIRGNIGSTSICRSRNSFVTNSLKLSIPILLVLFQSTKIHSVRNYDSTLFRFLQYEFLESEDC